ncbi:MAG TPA: class I lanthipeptide [Thermoanaerobaculia bacterium]|nr:class I lanthipeptide [Thermoanaerobaculia bacterium]
MQKRTKKLSLHRDTLRRLNPDSLTEVAGGGYTFTRQNTVIEPDEPGLTQPVGACTIPVVTYPWC